MKLTINGEPQLSSAETLGALIETLGMKPDRVAIELNREIVPRDQWPQTPLHDGDRLEIVHFVGGGSVHDKFMDCHPDSERSRRGGICSSPLR
jgi:thiamine biosynthesis protein ThiS